MPRPVFELVSVRSAPSVPEGSPGERVRAGGALPALPDDDELLTFDELAALLKRHRKTVERDPFFRARIVRVGARGIRVRRSTYRLYLTVNSVEGAA